MKVNNMTDVSLQISNDRHELVDPESEAFAKAFPHLSLLRRPLTREQMRDRALSPMWSMAALALKELHRYEERLIDPIVTSFMKCVFDSDVLNKFDPKLGDIDGFLYGVMRWAVRGYLGKQSRQRREAGSDQSLLFRCSTAPGPAQIAEHRDLMQHIREWAAELPPAQRDAVARRYTALADLDSGAKIRNEAVARHRGLKRLRQRAAKSKSGNGTG
jgi:hypothetical protein